MSEQEKEEQRRFIRKFLLEFAKRHPKAKNPKPFMYEQYVDAFVEAFYSELNISNQESK